MGGLPGGKLVDRLHPADVLYRHDARGAAGGEERVGGSG